MHYILYDESIEIGQFLNGRTGCNFEVLLFSFACLGTLVTEDEVNLWIYLGE